MMQVDTSPGAVTRVPGFKAASAACGLKQSGQPDLALVACDYPTTAAGVFTTNAFRAAPVLYDAALLARRPAPAVRAVVINAGNANACTGEQGLRDTERMARLAEQALGLPPNSVLVMSTGIIGHPMPMDKVEAGIHAVSQALSSTGGAAAARAIMTTDLVPKEAFTQVQIPKGHRRVGGAAVSIGGMVKGSGMIHPALARFVPASGQMAGLHATMLSVIVTDARLPSDVLQAALEGAVNVSFNRVTVDGDTSTNDTVLLLASGQAGGNDVQLGSETCRIFQEALTAVCASLAKQIARDGEGATHLVEILVRGAASDAEAEQAAKTIATSPLVKTALFGADPNWGRILAAAGRSGARVEPARTSLWLGDIQPPCDSRGLPLVAGGMPLPFDVDVARTILKAPEVKITVDLGVGTGQATVWTCDLSYKYVEINAEYHT
jgi:glutamate N-acetyltransferase/amino-acid N-acetyltransferase